MKWASSGSITGGDSHWFRWPCGAAFILSFSRIGLRRF